MFAESSEVLEVKSWKSISLFPASMPCMHQLQETLVLTLLQALLTQEQTLQSCTGSFCPGRLSLHGEEYPLKLPSILGLLAHLLNFQVLQAIVSSFYVYIPSSLNLCLAKMQVGKLIHSFMSR